MKRIFYILIFILISQSPVFSEDVILLEENVVHEEEIKQDEGLVPDDSVLEVDTPHEEIIETREIPDLSKPPEFETPTFKDRISKGINDVYKLQIENTRVPSVLLKDKLTFNFEKGPVESVHIWTGLKMNMSEDIQENGDNNTTFRMGVINNFIDGKFRGGKENFRIMLDTTPQNDRPFMQHLFQDLYIDTKRIPHHRILVGNSPTSVGYEGAGSAYTLPFANRSQIARNFGTVRKLGVRVMGNYDFVDYDLGGFSSGTYFSDFFPGGEFDGWVNIKPLAKTNGKYGILKIGGGIATGKRDSIGFTVTSAYVGYEYKKFRIKGEFANANGSNGLSGLTNKHRQGWTVTAYYLINKKLEAIVRYDEFDPDKSIDNNNRREYTAGLSWYIKGQALKLILNYVFCQNQSAKDSHRIILGAQIAL